MRIRHGDLFVRRLHRPTPTVWTGRTAGPVRVAVVDIQNGRAGTVGVGADGRGGARVAGGYDGGNTISGPFFGLCGFLSVQDDFREGCHGGGEVGRGVPSTESWVRATRGLCRIRNVPFLTTLFEFPFHVICKGRSERILLSQVPASS